MIIYFCIISAIVLIIIMACSFEYTYESGDVIFYSVLVWSVFGLLPSMIGEHKTRTVDASKMNYVITKLPYSRMIILPKETNPKLEETLTFTFEKNLEISKIDSLEFGFYKRKGYNMWGYEVDEAIQVDFKK